MVIHYLFDYRFNIFIYRFSTYEMENILCTSILITFSCNTAIIYCISSVILLITSILLFIRKDKILPVEGMRRPEPMYNEPIKQPEERKSIPPQNLYNQEDKKTGRNRTGN